MQLLIAQERNCRLTFVFDCEAKFLLFRVRYIATCISMLKKGGRGTIILRFGRVGDIYFSTISN